MSIEKYEAKYGIQYLKKKTILVSYPKTGRTWLRMILTNACKLNGMDTEKYSPILALHKNFEWVSKNFTPTEDYSIVYLNRTAEDTIVSHYHEVHTRQKKFKGSISDFIRSKEYGIETYLNFDRQWLMNSHRFKSFFLVSYEQLKQMTFHVVSELLKHLGMYQTDDIVREAIEQSSFESMRKMENGEIENPMKNYKGTFGKIKPTKQNERRVRSGKIGSFKDVLSAEDIEYIRSHIVGVRNA